MNKVFVVMEDWRIDSGESGIENSVFSTFEKALEYYNHLKERYNDDYNINEMDEDEDDLDEEYDEDDEDLDDIEVDETVDVNSKYASIEVTFCCTDDYYKIWIDEKTIDSEVEGN